MPAWLANRRNGLLSIGVVGLLLILGLQLLLSVRRETQTWDEANHIFAGYRSWTHADFGLNPEHPPLVKLLATTPLFSSPLKTPKPEGRYFKEDAFLGGKDFLYQNDADSILLRTRISAQSNTEGAELSRRAANSGSAGGSASSSDAGTECSGVADDVRRCF